MDEAINQFLNTGTVVLAVAVFIVTFFIRRIAETAMPSLEKKADENAPGITYETSLARWYQSVILYAIPVVVGSTVGVFDIPFLFQTEGVDTLGGRVFYGAVVGWFSSFMYKVIRKVLVKKTGVDINPETSE